MWESPLKTTWEGTLPCFNPAETFRTELTVSWGLQLLGKGKGSGWLLFGFFGVRFGFLSMDYIKGKLQKITANSKMHCHRGVSGKAPLAVCTLFGLWIVQTWAGKQTDPWLSSPKKKKPHARRPHFILLRSNEEETLPLCWENRTCLASIFKGSICHSNGALTAWFCFSKQWELCCGGAKILNKRLP